MPNHHHADLNVWNLNTDQRNCFFPINFLNNCQPLKELVQVFKILNVCADRVDAQPLYEQPIIDILKICSLPYLKEKASDELVYEQIVIESISQLGKLNHR